MPLPTFQALQLLVLVSVSLLPQTLQVCGCHLHLPLGPAAGNCPSVWDSVLEGTLLVGWRVDPNFPLETNFETYVVGHGGT